jgi:hypothetical protein
MKCIKAIKESKYSKVGDIKRVTDKDADAKVGSGYWMYIPKSEWREYNKALAIEKSSNDETQTLKNSQKDGRFDKKQKNLKKRVKNI